MSDSTEFWKLRIFYSYGKQRIIPKIIELPRAINSLVLFLLLLKENLIVKNESKIHNAAVKIASLLVKSSAGNKNEPSYAKRAFIPKKFAIKYKTLQDKTAIDWNLPSVVMEF